MFLCWPRWIRILSSEAKSLYSASVAPSEREKEKLKILGVKLNDEEKVLQIVWKGPGFFLIRSCVAVVE